MNAVQRCDNASFYFANIDWNIALERLDDKFINVDNRS